MINIGVIGCGEWGPNHIRIFSAIEDSTVLMGCDLDAGRIRAMKRLYPNVIFTRDYKEVLKDKRIDAVCIATPSSALYKLTKEALLAGKDVLCEKPLAANARQCRELIEISRKKKHVLMIGYVFLFNSGINKIRQYVQDNRLGAIRYIYSKRTNLGPFRYDVNALWDLAPHDVAICNYLMGNMPIQVSARGARYLSDDREDVIFMTLTYPNGILANIHASWLDPKKIRQITIVGNKKMLEWDDLDQQTPIRLYNKRVKRMRKYYSTFKEFQLLSKEGEVVIPRVELEEPLKLQNLYFLKCVRRKSQPKITSGPFALHVIKVLAAAQKSIEKSGAPVKTG